MTVTIECNHCGDPFQSPHYGPEICYRCKAKGHFDGSAQFCRQCQLTIAEEAEDRKLLKQGDE